MKLARAEQMREIDRQTMDAVGIPGVVLMEHAGARIAALIIRDFGPLRGRKIDIFAGPGNNGGDGFVIARHLHEQGAEVTVRLLVPEEKIGGDAASHFRSIRSLGIPVLEPASSPAPETLCLDDRALLVDALFGTGLAREISGYSAAVVQAINRAACPVVAVDMPSGVDSDSGRVLGEAVRADCTITFALAKPGHFVFPGRELVGRLEVIDIGIPQHVIAAADLQCEALENDLLRPFIPIRPTNSHKGTYGHLLLLAGSRGKSGAALLAVLGGLRSGAGLVTLCAASEVTTLCAAAIFEAMTVPLSGGPDAAPIGADADRISAALAGKQALVVGPGLGREEETMELVRRLYREVQVPLVLDADGLIALADHPGSLAGGGAARILTPHPGEMARLTGSTSREIQNNRLEAAVRLARRCGGYVVLKGAGTIIAAPDGRVAVNSTGNPGMAAGGMGDVLAGLIGGLLAQGLSPWQACCLAVFVHGRAADLLAVEMGAGYLASEVAERLPRVMASLRGEQRASDSGRVGFRPP